MNLLGVTLLLTTVEAFLLQPSVNRCHIALKSAANEGEHELSRRSTLSGMVRAASSVSLMTSFPVISNAVSNEKPKEFIDVGTQAPAPNGETEFIELSNGVKVKDFRPGSGDETVKANSQVQIQASGRLLNLNGVVFYNTKNNNPDGFGAIPLTINLGKGEAIPGLEAGIIGMRKGGIRR